MIGHWTAVITGALTLLAAAGPAGAGAPRPGWPQPNQNLESTRAAQASTIDSTNVGRLAVKWRFRFTSTPHFSGVYASNPVVLGDRVYVQDLNSNVFALDRETGAVVWQRRFRAPTGGPNGLAAVDGRILGNSDTRAFALDLETGRTLWIRRLINRFEQFVDIAPVGANGLMYTSTVGYPPGGKGAFYGLDAATGEIRWKFVTIRDPWWYPFEAGGGGAWFPPSVDADGRTYWGNSNPGPWGGSRKRPNGGDFPGPALYTDSLLVVDGASGELLWYDQVTPHDIRDYDFQLSPILARLPVGGVETDVVLGAGKAGRVIAWDRASRRRLWEAEVGLHRNDRGPLPPRLVRVCPGLFGGVETPMAYAAGRLFVPVVNLCMKGSAFGYEDLAAVDYSKGTGELVALDAATGTRLWRRRLPSALFGCATVANDVVFTAAYDGAIYAFSAADGSTLWQAQAQAGVNACPAVDGDMLLVGAGTDHPRFAKPARELVAYALP